MAGMLPGVECARRRRFHGSGGASDSPSTVAHGLTRRSTFCLYISNNESHSHLSSSSSLLRSSVNQSNEDEKLGGVAREAKVRLDERLRAQRKTETKRNKTQEVLGGLEGRTTVSRDLQIEAFGVKKSGSKRFSWGKFGWKAVEQDECAICLEEFKAGELLANPRCAHRFHFRCLQPWLENNAHCPCCRMGIMN